MSAIETPDAVCPSCSYEFKFASNLNGDGSPDTGDISICVRCAGIGMFVNDDGQITIEKFPPDLEAALLSRDDVSAVVARVIAVTSGLYETDGST